MRLTVLAAVAVLCLVAAVPAGANTLAYTGSTSSTDNTLPFVPFDQNGPTTCATPAQLSFAPAPGGAQYRKYAFRNASASGDCITVTGINDCAQGETFDVSLSPAVGLLGSDEVPATCAGLHSHSFAATAGQVFVEFVVGLTPSAPFGLTVAGADVVPVHLLSVTDAPLSNSNTVSASVTSLEDGSDVQGTLSASAGPSQHYSGPVRCLRISGNTASLVMTFDGTQEGLASKWKGAVYWFRQSQDGTEDAQRNSILDQSQLNGKYATCPDPTTPLSPGFRMIGSSDGPVLVVANGPQAGA